MILAYIKLSSKWYHILPSSKIKILSNILKKVNPPNRHETELSHAGFAPFMKS